MFLHIMISFVRQERVFILSTELYWIIVYAIKGKTPTDLYENGTKVSDP